MPNNRVETQGSVTDMATDQTTASASTSRIDILDYIGVGFGPANLSLAVAAREANPQRRGVFFERKTSFDWHPGLLLDSSRMQISFLKDLVTLRNPASPFSFLAYTKAKGRLEHFVNLSEWHPSRWEYRDYLRWVAEAFATNVRYGSSVRSIRPAGLDGEGRYRLFEVEVECLSSGERSVHLTRNVVYAAGGRPRHPFVPEDARDVVYHSSDFASSFLKRFDDTARAFRFTVIGNGQSAGEVVAYLMQHYPQSRIDVLMPDYALRPADHSFFVNEAFFFSRMEEFHASTGAERKAILRELRNTNYGAVSPELADQIYRDDYLDQVKGFKRLFFHRFKRLVGLERRGSDVLMTAEDVNDRQTLTMLADGIVMATGYDRRLDPSIFEELEPFLQKDDDGHLEYSAHCRIKTDARIAGGLFAQGYGETSYGPGDTLLSLLPFRSRDLAAQMFATPKENSGSLPTDPLAWAEYPPARHLEHDRSRMHAVLEACPFATLVSADNGVPVVTHLPLILNRLKGQNGTLFGHLDRANPQLALLDGRPLLAIFHGPNAYISPNVYRTSQLPTWNSIAVHVSGRIRLITDKNELLEGLASISERDDRPDAFRLDLASPRIERIVNYIVGFEIEIEEMVGRFKLSQDRNSDDLTLAASELAHRSEVGARDLIETCLGIALPPRADLAEPVTEISREVGFAPADLLHGIVASLDPTRLAIVSDGFSLTYGELEEKANRVANHLRTLGAKPDVVVGLCVERSPMQLVGLLGILKSGAAFMPLDAEAPTERLSYMLAETQAPLILTQESMAGRFGDSPVRCIRIDSDWQQIAAAPHADPRVAVDTDNLAYLLYTSGSTGRPKAVAMPHRGIVNHVLFAKDLFRYTPADRVLQFWQLTGDGAIQEIFCAWAAGAAVVVSTNPAPSLHSFMSTLSRHRVSVVNLPTAYWHFWVTELKTNTFDWPSTLRIVNVGGERVIPERLRQWQALPDTSHVTWINDYGPTEAAVSSTNYVAGRDDGVEELCIGRPNANVDIYILDEDGMQVEPGETGELYIGGPGLARGYFTKPALTAEKFLPNPFGTGTRLYRTGDRARHRADGNIEFLGRLDDQVKVMGHRVELGEVEGALLRCDGIRNAAISIHDDPNGPRITAHVVTDAFDEPLLRKQLAAQLPRHAMPSIITHLAALPLTHNGKIDRIRLTTTACERNGAVLRNSGDLENTISTIWAEVTGRAPISVTEDFFLVGGDSLRALSLVSRLATQTGTDIGIAAFLRDRTVRGIATALATAAPAHGSKSRERVDRRSSTRDSASRLARGHDTERPASNAQQRLWVLDRLQSGSPTYSVPLAYRIAGRLSIDRLDRALSTIVSRHEALRTSLAFTKEDGLTQSIWPATAIRSDIRHADDFSAALELARAESAQPLDLERPPLLRSVCIEIGHQETLWLLILHHVACDAWSIGILWRELAHLYSCDEGLPEPKFQYADYASWQREWLHGPDADEHRAFWRDRLGGELPLLNLGHPIDHNDRTASGGSVDLPFEASFAAAIKQLAGRLSTTPFVVLLSAFTATLHRTSGQEQLLIGVPTACRTLAETSDIFGFFANTLPLRINLDATTTFAELVRQAADVLAEALAHQELPFDEIVDALGIARRDGSNPIFQAMFVMESTAFDEPPGLPGVSVQEVAVHSGTAKVDVTCSIRMTAESVEGELEYDLAVLGRPEANRLVRSLTSLLSEAMRDPDQRVGTMGMLSPVEAAELVSAANSQFERYPDPLPLHRYIETQAASTPEAVAIEHGSSSMLYAELNARANRLARRLVAIGAGPERLIGICMDRSIAMVTAVLAVSKAGAGFVPLDPRFPVERLKAIAGDAALLAIVTQHSHAEDMENFPCALIVENPDESGDGANLDIDVATENIAYVYYTSGSTGKPKGVVLDHRVAMKRLQWLLRRYPLRVGDRLLHKTPLIFDVAIWEIFGPLMAGATILMADHGAEADVGQIGALLSRPGTVFAHFVPSMLEAYLEASPQRAYPDLRWVQLSGEAASGSLLANFGKHFKAEFHNLYGQTETSEVAGWENSMNPATTTVPIGRQIGIYRLYLLDEAFNPVPPGVPGEIYVAGLDGLARGYLGRPALTAEKFVPNPYALTPGEQMYRTGDVGRMTENGLIEFVGRTDHQVKIAGCRVEVAEIEAVLLRHPSVRKCAVIARSVQYGGLQLIAYVVGSKPDINEWRAHVERHLPRYMVPSAFVLMPHLPVTASGKLDRLQLPPPSETDFVSQAEIDPPQTQLEVKVAAIWQDVLGLKRIGREDHFFTIGGNSLKAIQILARLEQAFNVTLRISTFWTSPTIAELSIAVESALIDYITALSDAEIADELVQET